MNESGFRLTRDLTLLLRGDLIKRSLRKVKVVCVFARGAGISDGHGDTLAVVGVRELDLPATVSRLGVEVAVELSLCRTMSITEQKRRKL